MQTGSQRSGFLLGMVLALCAAIAAPGCRSVSRLTSASAGPPPPVVLPPTATAEQVVAVVNQNTQRVQSYVTNNASISVPGFPNLPVASGSIAYERPLNFRFQARALTGPEVDFGSNTERFWLWAKQMTGPDGRSPLYTVRHDQYASSGAQNMMPIDPQWIIEALGMVTINQATMQPPLPRNDGGFEVRYLQDSPRGPLTRVLVIDSHGQVTQQSVLSPQGALLASATASQFRYDPQTAVSLPRVVTVQATAADLSLKINTGDVSVNGVVGNPAVLFQPPVMQNHPVVDLGASLGQVSQAGAPPTVATPPLQQAG
ncbi:MAG: hypothetical protein KDA37_11030 [Planctomycetales bacterium]|nr:hypothetical protein [Planctomycetales bacterium]